MVQSHPSLSPRPSFHNYESPTPRLESFLSPPPPRWCPRPIHSLAESFVCQPPTALVVEWQCSSLVRSSGESSSRSRGPGEGGVYQVAEKDQPVTLPHYSTTSYLKVFITHQNTVCHLANTHPEYRTKLVSSVILILLTTSSYFRYCPPRSLVCTSMVQGPQQLPVGGLTKN